MMITAAPSAIREIKFTAPNLDRHLCCSEFTQGGKYTNRGSVGAGSWIITVRDEPKGSPGDVVWIRGVGCMTIVGIYEFDFTQSTSLRQFHDFCSEYFAREGFATQLEYAQEIIRIYGRINQKFYVHNLLLLKNITCEESAGCEPDDAAVIHNREVIQQ